MLATRQVSYRSVPACSLHPFLLYLPQVSTVSTDYSHWRAIKSLSDWLKEQGIPGICNVDTRALTKELRVHGCMLGKV
jgi:hypothetical protein